MLLIHPPLAKACEPPAGIVRLAAVMRANEIPCRLLDANLEGQLWLMEQPPGRSDTWTRRAYKGRGQNIAALRDASTYSNPARYRRAVSDLNRLLAISSHHKSLSISLSDYQHKTLSPLRSDDLLAAALRPEDNPFFPYFCKRFPEMLDGVSTIGFSLNYLSQALCTFAMIGHIRVCYPGLKIVLGGGLVTSWMQKPDWDNPFAGLVDHIISGPGELPLLRLHGVNHKSDHSTPDYSELPTKLYISPGFILPYSAADGCWWNQCSFCPEQAEGNIYRPIAVKQALSDLKMLTEQNAPRLIHLLDNAISPAMLRGLADNPPGAPWYGFARIDGQLADLDFCLALKRSGCVMLKLGLESGDQGVLESMRKGIELAVASQTLKNLQRAGIAVYCYLLFGTPGENDEAARRTLQFVVKHRQAISFLNLALFNMPLHCDEAKIYGTDPFYVADLSLYTAFRHPLGWDRKNVRNFLEYEFKRHPAVAVILRNDPPQFTSNHAPLLHCIRQNQ